MDETWHLPVDGVLRVHGNHVLNDGSGCFEMEGERHPVSASGYRLTLMPKRDVSSLLTVGPLPATVGRGVLDVLLVKLVADGGPNPAR